MSTVLFPTQDSPHARRAALARAAVNLACGIAYGAALALIYRNLSVWWDYLGFTYQPLPAEQLVGLVLFAGIPAAFLPVSPKTLSGFVTWILYFTLFLPAMLIPPLQGFADRGTALALLFTLWASALGFVLAARIRRLVINPLPVNPRAFWIGIGLLWLGGHALVAYYFSSVLNFAALGDVYEQRAVGADIAGSSLIMYLMYNLAGAVNPLLIAVGIAYRRKLALAAGVVGQIVIYSTLANKVVILSTFVIAGTVFLFDKDNRLRVWRISSIFLAIVLIGIPLTGRYTPDTGFGSDLIDIMYMRTLCLPGVLIGAYNDFFSRFPVTYFSHSWVGALFTTYPYGDLSVGQVIGDYLTPSGSYDYNNYNAGFLASDGLTSLGIVGLPVSTALTASCIWGIDCLTTRVDRRVLFASFIPFLMSLADGSLFTSLLTSGGIFLSLLLYLGGGAPPRDRRLRQLGMPSPILEKTL